MKKIGVIAKPGAPGVSDTVRDLVQWLDRQKCSLLLEDGVASTLALSGYTRDTIATESDVIIVFGGDGTLLSVARLIGNRGVPILGVNLGGLGFIAEASKEDLRKSVIDYIFTQDCRYEERIMLSSDVYRAEKCIAQNTALNDVVIHKSALARMIAFEMYVNGQYVTNFRADGMIISTPTGSTGHSLSAGGPILYPTLESFVISPICPHTLANRPIVIPDDFVLEIAIHNGEDVHLTLDGQEGLPLQEKDRVMIKKADFKTKFIVLHDRDYFRILKTKLKWGT